MAKTTKIKKTKKTKKVKAPIKTLVVNLFGGPSAGKSKTMAGIFSELKFRGVNCEMATEYVKGKVWEGSLNILNDQIYVFGKQYHRIFIVLGEVEVVITDSPLLFSLVYGEKEGEQFKKLVLETHNRLWNKNIYLVRKHKYNPSGRTQSEKQAIRKDKEIHQALIDNGIPFEVQEGTKENISKISDEIVDIIGKGKLIFKPLEAKEGKGGKSKGKGTVGK
jgi:hypothetical protein